MFHNPLKVIIHINCDGLRQIQSAVEKKVEIDMWNALPYKDYLFTIFQMVSK